MTKPWRKQPAGDGCHGLCAVPRPEAARQGVFDLQAWRLAQGGAGWRRGHPGPCVSARCDTAHRHYMRSFHEHSPTFNKPPSTRCSNRWSRSRTALTQDPHRPCQSPVAGHGARGLLRLHVAAVAGGQPVPAGFAHDWRRTLGKGHGRQDRKGDSRVRSGPESVEPGRPDSRADAGHDRRAPQGADQGGAQRGRVGQDRDSQPAP